MCTYAYEKFGNQSRKIQKKKKKILQAPINLVNGS